VLVLPTGTYFMADPYVIENPDATEIAEMTIHSAEAVRRFGIEPKVALLSHSNFGSAETASAEKMRAARRLIKARAPELEVEGEMQADLAFSAETRQRIFSNSQLQGSTNLLILPNLDAANIAFNMVKALGGGKG
jgi:malate dehydrogenase (oxaloacetate-decarboxylating)(NADP+)